MSQSKKSKQSFGSLLLTYRKIIILSLFFVLLPIVIVIGVYSGTKANGEKIKMKADATTTISSNKFDSIEDFDDFNLTFEYVKLAKIVDPENSEKTIGNSYTFKVSYTKNIQDVSKVSISSVLVGPWSTYQVIKEPINLSEGSQQNLVVEFKKVTPYSPLLFVTVEHPIMYLEVKYTIAGLEHINYLKYDLSTAKNVVIS